MNTIFCITSLVCLSATLFAGLGTSPSVTNPQTPSHATPAQPKEDCDGGSSKCSPCLDQYNDYFMPCNKAFDEHVLNGTYSAQQVMECYEKAFTILHDANVASQATKPLICPGKIRKALANHTRMHEEHINNNNNQ